jgi:hypothetical protein
VWWDKRAYSHETKESWLGVANARNGSSTCSASALHEAQSGQLAPYCAVVTTMAPSQTGHGAWAMKR